MLDTTVPVLELANFPAMLPPSQLHILLYEPPYFTAQLLQDLTAVLLLHIGLAAISAGLADGVVDSLRLRGRYATGLDLRS